MNIYTVCQVNKYIRNMFDNDFVLENISVSGEVSNCKYHTSGHIYFTLKDKDGTLAAVMFAGNRASGLKFRLEDGMKVVASGNISIYEAAGKYQLYVRQIKKEGSGELYERYLALKKELEEMGMFDPMYKKPIPKYIKTLGVVTAATGAAVHDIVNIATRRNPYIQIVLCPAQVQGEGAALSISKGIERLDKYGVDVIIAGRGGGSIEDLWAFNEEIVAKTIFNCNTPVISAVGHETDFTIADFVSDLRAPTPSAAAELAVMDVLQVMKELSDYAYTMSQSLKNRVEMYRNRVLLYTTRLKHLSPANILDNRRQQLDDISDRINRAITDKLRDRRHMLSLLGTKLNALSPLVRLESGYSYVANEDGKAVTSVSDIKTKDEITVHVMDGKITAEVIKTTAIERLKYDD